ncbi:MAG: hypothetical protein ACRDOU_21325 [Streptosporangiaceae bacterium]
MTMTRRTTAPARPITGLARIGRRIVGALAECDYAQRRIFTLMTTPDSYLTDRDGAPDCYAEFLFRTSGSLMHEPTAADREDLARGRRAA